MTKDAVDFAMPIFPEKSSSEFIGQWQQPSFVDLLHYGPVFLGFVVTI
jgi:hypothetical protein